jgi:chromosomal replication initiator protein
MSKSESGPNFSPQIIVAEYFTISVEAYTPASPSPTMKASDFLSPARGRVVMKSTGWMDRFLPLPESRSALVAVQRLADGAVDAVYLHGPSGSGKTHLARLLIELLRDRTTALVSAREGFAAGSSRPTAHALVVEDLQFLPENGVERLIDLLEERRGLPTLVTGNVGPGALRHRGERMPARLTSRLAAGLVVSIAPPGPASRRLVLDRWLAGHRLDVAPDLVDWLARKARGLRALESAVAQIVLLRRMSDKLPGAEAIREHLEKHLETDRPSVDRITGHVAIHYRVPAKELRSRSRRRAILVPRHVSMYLTRQLTPMSFQQIGSYFGGCDHSTVLYACRKVEESLGEDAVLSGTVRQLHDELC